MSQTVSLSTRVSPQVRDRLAAAAAERGVPLATYTRGLLSVPSPGLDAPAAGDGEVVNEVRCVFHGLPMEAGLRREICLSLARTVEQGGSAGIAAGRELLIEIGTAQRLFEPEDDWDADEDEGV